MSASDSKQSRYANTNANARLNPQGWASERDYRPPGAQRYGSVLVLSGPKVRLSTFLQDFAWWLVLCARALGNRKLACPVQPRCFTRCTGCPYIDPGYPVIRRMYADVASVTFNWHLPAARSASVADLVRWCVPTGVHGTQVPFFLEYFVVASMRI